jgi:hypothetical protein
LPPLGKPLRKGLSIPYTHWEAWLALYHGKALLIAKAKMAEIGCLGLPPPTTKRDADRLRPFGSELEALRGGRPPIRMRGKIPCCGGIQ